MSKIVAFWDAVVDEIKARVPELREVRKYANEFDDADKGKISIKTPGALVAVTGNGVAVKLSDGRLKVAVAVAVAVIAEDRGRSLDTTAAEIAEKVFGAAHQNRFFAGEGEARKPTAQSDPDEMTIINYNSDKTLARGLSVWGVGWEQAVIIGDQQFVEPPSPDLANGGYQPVALPGDEP